MQQALAARFRILGHPVVAAGLAVIIILTLGSLGASKLEPRNAAELQDVEKVAVMKSIMAAPQPPATTAAPAPAAASSMLQPQIARTGKMSLFVNDVGATVRRLSGVARRNGGDVFSLTVSNEDRRSAASAQMEIRVPARAFDAAMEEAARLGNVRERSSGAEDLTGDITDSSARLRNLRQTEADIRRIMDRSGNVSQVMDAESQLSSVREQIETLESSIAAVRGRVTYSTLDFDVEAEIAAQPVEPTAGSQLANAWHAALHAVTQTAIGLAALALWIVAFAPFAIGAALLALLLVMVLRRGRHGAQTNPRGA